MQQNRSRSAPFVVVAMLLIGSLCAQRGSPTLRRVQVLPGMSASSPTHQALPTNPIVAVGPTLPAILLTGYWPPSNEAVRKFSISPTQNPGGWQGANWEGRGYDIYSYFPEFNPANCSFCGAGTGDLTVDYQDTVTDFFQIADTIRPVAVITFSRGSFGSLWEMEMNQYNRAAWVDDYIPPLQPTPVPPDATVPAGFLRESTLPVQDVVNAVTAANLGLNAFICFSGDGGGFLSEFIAYLGVWYQSMHQAPTDPNRCVAAGHVHVGTTVSWSVAETAAEITVREVIARVDMIAANTVCQPDRGFQGPGNTTMLACGDPLTTAGGYAELRVSNGIANAPAVLVLSDMLTPIALLGGTLGPNPVLGTTSATFDQDGALLWQGLPTGLPQGLSVFVQAISVDAAIPSLLAFSNVIELQY